MLVTGKWRWEEGEEEESYLPGLSLLKWQLLLRLLLLRDRQQQHGLARAAPSALAPFPPWGRAVPTIVTPLGGIIPPLCPQVTLLGMGLCLLWLGWAMPAIARTRLGRGTSWCSL